MPFTIVKTVQGLPSYAGLVRVAEKNHVRLTGDDQVGSFAGHGVAGDYAFSPNGIHGRFAGHGITGEFAFEADAASVTILDKPFWIPETLLRQKITAGLDELWKELD